jgi:hypothetical protein
LNIEKSGMDLTGLFRSRSLLFSISSLKKEESLYLSAYFYPRNPGNQNMGLKNDSLEDFRERFKER